MSSTFLQSLLSAISKASLPLIQQTIVQRKKEIAHELKSHLETNLDTTSLTIALDETHDYTSTANEAPLLAVFNVPSEATSEATSEASQRETTILHMIQCLVENGFSVNRRDVDGNTPLMRAAAFGFERIARYLYNEGADASLLNNQNRSALSFACESASFNIVHFVLSDSKVSRSSKVDIINEPSRDTSRTPLHFAALCPSEDIVKLLVSNSTIEVDPVDENGETPLMFASRIGHVGIVQFLIQNGADVLQLNHNCETAMVLAAQNKHYEVVFVLKGAWRMYRFQHETSNLQPAVAQLIHDVGVLMSRGNDVESYVEPILLRLSQLEKNQRQVNKKVDALMKRATSADQTTPFEFNFDEETDQSTQDTDTESNTAAEDDAELSIWNEMVDEIDSQERFMEERKYFESLGLFNKFTQVSDD